MKYKVFMDITVSKILYGIEAETDEQAQAIALEKVKNDPFYYAAHADGFVKAEVEDFDEDEDDDPLAKYSETYRDGIRYMLSQLDEDDKAIIRAKCNKALNQHLIPDSNIVDDSKITDLLEEYGADKELPEGWYLDEYDASEILAKI